MKISRKLQRQVENKIRHAIATGVLPVVERGAGPNPKAEKSEGNDLGHAK